MDLRTKLVFGLVAASLLGMLALGTLAYTSAEQLIIRRSEQSLASLAEAKAERVASVVRGWEEATNLLASRTQLRQSLADWNANGFGGERERIARILEDARTASSVVEGVAVFDSAGRFIAGTGARATPGSPEDGRATGAQTVRFVGFTADQPPRVTYTVDLRMDTQTVGTLRAVLSTRALADVASNRTGLRETGETLIATPGPDGTIRLLTPLRHAPDTVPDGALSPAHALMRDALAGVEGPITESLDDYRGEPVWVAMRRVETADIGLLVKFDVAEELADLALFRARLIGVGFSLAGFAILLGVAMGFTFARPINALAHVAARIRDGDLSARADADRQDEIGLLASAFNDMSAELERRMKQLQEYKTFFDESEDLLCIASVDGYFKRVNPAFVRTLGWSEQELLGRPFFDFIHPDDVDATTRETEKLARGIPTISFVNRYRCGDGSYRTLRWTSHPDPATGNLYAVARSMPAD